ncbi:hypothetical protein K432DRAFT_386523 [Lepidopterella palustris CBS 459.81]|uniref:Large ribosomal subunit protein mL67 n=1 Tax=Lepidopterella palustris CBS 459.81 TaxID=1314670 RepID=A0A8E2E028_9PEZI|nr:hypothetical protein K432DRAFT_386523 [Lepidopterella palustris CBS 459.81]
MPPKLGPDGLRSHGKHIFVYNNISTNQVLYSLRQKLDDSALNQLIFIGKHSIPPSIRPDLWKPLYTVTFSNPAQGLSAYQKLREFRRLHELCWDTTNPEKLKLHRKARITFLMNQKANSIADLAKVLFMQAEKGVEMEENIKRRKEEVAKVAAAKWAEIEALAARADSGEVKTIEKELERLMPMYERRAEKEKERIGKAIALQKKYRKRLLWAQSLVRARKAEDAAKEAAICAAKKKTKSDTKITVSVIPKRLRRRLPKPMTLDGVSIQWANLSDAEYAAKWPEDVVHDIMGVVKRTAPNPKAPSRQWPPTEDEVKKPGPLDIAKEEQEIMEKTTLDGKSGEDGEEKKESRGFFSRLFRRRGTDDRVNA